MPVRRALTLIELMIALTVTAMILVALGGLARTVEQGFEYSEGYGAATQHARVALDRISENVCQATANMYFPGCIVVPETVNSVRFPDTLVIWRPSSGTASSPEGLPLYSELVIYCPNPATPNELVEITAPTDTRTVPAVSDTASWLSQLSTLKTATTSKKVVLTTLLRTCPISSGTTTLRGAVRFETRLRPSAEDLAGYQSGAITWKALPWVQGIYGPKAGMRQVWVRTELQLMPGVEWIASGASADAIPFLGSAALYYNLAHP